MCGQVVRPLLGGGAGGRSPGFIYKAPQICKVTMRCPGPPQFSSLVTVLFAPRRSAALGYGLLLAHIRPIALSVALRAGEVVGLRLEQIHTTVSSGRWLLAFSFCVQNWPAATSFPAVSSAANPVTR